MTRCGRKTGAQGEFGSHPRLLVYVVLVTVLPPATLVLVRIMVSVCVECVHDILDVLNSGQTWEIVLWDPLAVRHQRTPGT